MRIACFVIISLSKTHVCETHVYACASNKSYFYAYATNVDAISTNVRNVHIAWLNVTFETCMLHDAKQTYKHVFSCRCVIDANMRECMKKRFVLRCNARNIRACMNVSCRRFSCVTRAYTRFSTRVDVQTLHMRKHYRHMSNVLNVDKRWWMTWNNMHVIHMMHMSWHVYVYTCTYTYVCMYVHMHDACMYAHMCMWYVNVICMMRYALYVCMHVCT